MPLESNRRPAPPSLEVLEDRTVLSGVRPLYQLVRASSGVMPLASPSPNGYSPSQISQAYGFNQIQFGGVAGNGAGQTIAIVDAYDDPNILPDLNAFSAQFGLPTTSSNLFTFSKVNEVGGTTPPSASTSWAIEESLDVEWAHAIAPEANIVLVEASSNFDSDIYAAIGLAASLPNVSVVSMSFGESENSTETSLDSQYFVTPANHANVAFVASAGDSGAPPEYPSASPNVLAVGGTSLQAGSFGNYQGESAWSGGGGGVSSFEPLPTYQSGIVPQGTTNRSDPDVAYDANPGTGFPVYDSFTYGASTPWQEVGGTSAGAPQWSALVAIADQGRALASEAPLDGPSQLLPMIYSLPTSDFHDITTGNSNGSPKEFAGPGYDLVTGIGTPLANLVVPGLVGSTSTTSTSTTLTSSVNPTLFGQSVTFTAQVSGSGGVPAGSVAFRDGSATLATVSLSNGSASFTTSALAVGGHSLTAVYSGSATYAASTSAVLSQTVAKGMSADALSVSPAPSIAGQTVTLTATLSAVAPATGTPNGTVTFRDGSTVLGSARLNAAGVAVFQTSALSAGSHSLNAIWYGNSNYSGSTSPSISQTVVSAPQTPSSTTLSGSLASSVYGQSVTFTAQVTGAGGTPTGVVTFLNGSTTLGTGVLSNGMATFSIATLVPASYSVTASYGGDATFQSSTSSAQSLTVSQSGAGVALTSSANPSGAGQSVTFTATVTATAPGAGTPTGSVVFYDGTTQIGSATLNGGSAIVSTSALPVGSDTVTAVYGGDSNFLGQTSSPLTQVINPPSNGSSATTLTASVNPTSFGQSVTFTAQVSGSGGVPAGSVAFRDGSATLATVTLSNGSASFTTSALAVGGHSLTAVYSGSATYATSTSAVLSQTVAKGMSADALSVSPAPSVAGQTVTLTATLSAVAPATGTPNGTVTFRDGSTVLGSARLNAAGVAVFQTSALSAGSHSLNAVWYGNSSFAGSTSPTVALIVNQASSVVEGSNRLEPGRIPAENEAKLAGLVTRSLRPSSETLAILDRALAIALSDTSAATGNSALSLNGSSRMIETDAWGAMEQVTTNSTAASGLQDDWVLALILGRGRN
jgi:subtilase family serine protease